MALLEVNNLGVSFFTKRGIAKAVDGISFSVEQGETLGLVGESGSGKTMTCLALLRLVPQPAGRIVGGEIMLNGENLLTKSEDEMRKIRGASISMIMQDPMTSLNPVFTIEEQVEEAIVIHERARGASLREKCAEILRLVRIPSPELRMRDYPHQLSGGMRQRVAGAIALSCQPRVLIADEPTTSLDVTIQAQYLRLLRDIQREARLAVIFVTHDFGVVARMCDRVAVMYAGKIVEIAGVRELFNNPAHPYTMALMRSVPKVEVKEERLPRIDGQPPSLYDIPDGCAFSPRCEDRSDLCRPESPPTRSLSHDHQVTCWRYYQA